MERLQNIIAHSGAASRRGAADLIQAGAVSVDGKVVYEPGMRPPEGAVIRLHGRKIEGASRKRTVVLNKPVGVVSTMSDPFGAPTVAELVRTSERLVPVGRLDRDSDGLLLMSNDGELVNRLTHPRFEHEKTYIVKVAGRWNDEKMAILTSPIKMDDGYVIRPVPVEVLSVRPDNTVILKFVLKEGRKRQIRKMCSAAHLVVLSLTRVAVGGFNLPKDLPPGKWRDLTEEEIALLTK